MLPDVVFLVNKDYQKVRQSHFEVWHHQLLHRMTATLVTPLERRRNYGNKLGLQYSGNNHSVLYNSNISQN